MRRASLGALLEVLLDFASRDETYASVSLAGYRFFVCVLHWTPSLGPSLNSGDKRGHAPAGMRALIDW